MASSVNIFHNPFILLAVAASASATEIAEAYEDAIADANVSQADLAAARQSILSPPLRLTAEMGCLLDTPKQDWRSILTALKSNQSLTELRRAFAKVAPLSRANLLAHIAARTPADASTMIAWVDAQSKVDTDRIQRELDRVRELARVAAPDRAAVAAALDQLRENHARAIFEAFSSPADAIEAASICVRETIASEDQKQIDLLGVLLHAYRDFISQELGLRRERVNSTGEDLKANPDNAGNLAIFVDALSFWNAASLPLQALELHKARDDPAAQEVFWQARGIAIDLANRLSRLDLALTLTEACQRIFEKLPRAADQLKEDRDALKSRLATLTVEPLAEALFKIEKDLTQMVSDLRRAGFGQMAVGQAKCLRDVLLTTLASSRGSEAAELPWVLVRSLAIKLNNEAEAPDSALELVRGLLSLAHEHGITDQLRSSLHEDERAAERNKLEKELVGHLNAKRFGPALTIIENLLRDQKGAEERATLENLRSGIRKHRNKQYFRWAFWPAVALLIIYVASTGQKPSTPSYRPAPTYVPPSPEASPPPPKRDYSEQMPLIGRDHLLGEAGIRYCTFQKVRLEVIKRSLNDDFEIAEFNGLVDDYNSRCSSYRYRTQDKSAVDAEILLKKSSLEADADRILRGWRAARRPPQESATSPAAPNGAPLPTTAQPSNTETETANINAVQTNDLLNVADAMRVQSRLIELGFLKGSADGAWGAQSRAALRAFRAATSLPPSDAWDVTTADQLFAPTATHATVPQKPFRPLPDFSFQPPAGATLHPLNKDDATRIHARLRELGLYQAKNNLLWSTASRTALRDFKAAAGLPSDDEWDATTEQKLFEPRSADADFETLFAGVWATEVAACPGSGISTDTIPMRLTRNRAEAGAAGCDFLNGRMESSTWAAKAQCRADDKSWIANISLSRQGNQLNWTSERGTTTYFRCGS